LRQHPLDERGKNDHKLGRLAYTPGMGLSLSSFFTPHGDTDMLTKSLFARLEAKPSKEAELAAFLKQGLQLAQDEVTTPVWFALQLGPSTFGIFDAFLDETGRQAHLSGPIAKALMAQAPNLLAAPPVIERLDVIGAKVTG
jgi:quinol monooxygenase YgiN